MADFIAGDELSATKLNENRGHTSRVRAYLSSGIQAIRGTYSPMKVKFNSEDWDEKSEFANQVVSGTADSTVANKLHQTGKFTEAAAYYIGMSLENTTDGTHATVTAKDSDDQLSISANIMANTETYILHQSRFTAIAAGYYIVKTTIYLSGITVNRQETLYVYKNGSSVAQKTILTPNTGSFSMDILAIVYLNGTTDYVEIFAGHGTGGEYFGILNDSDKSFIDIHRIS